MVLYDYFRSSAAYRVRIALNLKGMSYEYVPVKLAFRDGDHDRPAYHAFNPQANVPVLEDGELRLMQSVAIMDYLDRRLPPDRPSATMSCCGCSARAAWASCTRPTSAG